MANTVIRVYDTFDLANHARDALIQSGFVPTDVRLDASIDEGGGVQGNSWIGNGNDERESYEGNYANARYRSAFVLTVDAADENQSRMAAEVLEKFDAEDAEERKSDLSGER